MNNMHNEMIDEFIVDYNFMKPNCIIYWCDWRISRIRNKRFQESLNGVLGPKAEAGVSPSESLWMFPLWDCFEEASV